MADTVYTIETALRRMIKDICSDGTAGPFMASDEYSAIILRNTTGDEYAYTLTKRSTNVFVWTGGTLSLFDVSYTGTVGVTYTVDLCGGVRGGPSVRRTAGTEVLTSFTLTGIPIDYRETAAQLWEYIANNRCAEYTQSIGGNSASPQTQREECLKQARIIRGAFGI
jgi:hypothetical protein